MKPVLIKTNMDVSQLDFVEDFFSRYGICVQWMLADQELESICLEPTINFSNDFCDYYGDNMSKSSANVFYLLSIEDREKYLTAMNSNSGLQGAEDGFSLPGSLAVIHNQYDENIIHELLHAIAQVEDCYDILSYQPKSTCDNDCCLMRYGNQKGIEICSDVKKMLLAMSDDNTFYA